MSTTHRAETVDGTWSHAGVDQVVRYFEDIAVELRSRGIFVEAVEVDTRRPASGRLVITGRTAADELWEPNRVALVWRAETGWWTEGPAEDAARAAHRFHDAPDAAPPTIACLVSDMMIKDPR